MNRKKLLAIAVSILTTITPNLNIAAMTENQNVSKTFVFISQNTPETFLAEYSRDGIELPPFSPINTNYLFYYIKISIKNCTDINEVKEVYFDFFKYYLYNNLITDDQTDERVADIFTFFFNYTIVKTLAEEYNGPKIGFNTIQKILKYLHNEDMHFLFHTYIVVNSNKSFKPLTLLVNNAIKKLAEKRTEKPLNNYTEDLICETFRNSSHKDPDYNIIVNELKNSYNEHISNFQDFFNCHKSVFTNTQKEILLTILKIIESYNSTKSFSEPIDIYENYINKK